MLDLPSSCGPPNRRVQVPLFVKSYRPNSPPPRPFIAPMKEYRFRRAPGMQLISNRQSIATLFCCIVAQAGISSTTAFLLPSSGVVALVPTTRTCAEDHPRPSSRASCGSHPQRTLRPSSLVSSCHSLGILVGGFVGVRKRFFLLSTTQFAPCVRSVPSTPRCGLSRRL